LLLTMLAAGLAGCASGPPATTPSATASGGTEAVLTRPLTDVRTGETFTLAELSDGSPVLVEPMAAWCSNCRAQQHEVARALEGGTFRMVSLGIDLSESADQLAEYADREGFDWPFALADPELYRLLQDRFGIGVTNPPSTPLIVIDADGGVRALELGQGTRSADALLAEIGG
jgi:thiol-disulfide isomerase/thioredoxin